MAMGEYPGPISFLFLLLLFGRILTGSNAAFCAALLLCNRSLANCASFVDSSRDAWHCTSPSIVIDTLPTPLCAARRCPHLRHAVACLVVKLLALLLA